MSKVFIFCNEKPTQIIGLLVGKNQSSFIPILIKALAFCTDSIIFFDNQSTDNSISVLKTLAQDYSIHVIQNKHALPMHEIYNQLLQEGRKQHGTHFLLLHAHEIPTAEYAISGRLKETIANLKSGQSLYLPIISVEKNFLYYNEDYNKETVEKDNFIGCAFADTENAFYEKGKDNRIPENIKSIQWYWQDNFSNGLMICNDYLFKQYVFEACIEKINQKIDSLNYYKEKIKLLNQSMIKSTFKKNTPFCWFAGYMDFFSPECILKADKNIEKTILNLCKTYGIDCFIDIDMWDYEWHFFDYLPIQEDPSMKSQYKQDLFINTYIFNNKKNGFFVDVGAHDGVKWSNSYFFEKTLEWNGLCIEPIKNAYQELLKNRKAICINGCAGKEEGQADFFNVCGAPDQLSGLVETYHPSHKKRMESETKETHGSYTIEKVPVYTLKNVFQKYTITHVDYISLDTEGSEMEIVQGIDFDKVYIKAMTIENMYFGTDLSNFMQSKGFKKVARLFNCDDVYVNMKKE